MRYADFQSSGRAELTRSGAAVATRPQRSDADLIREAARTDRYWIVNPETDGTWTVRQLDGTTGRLGDPAHTSEPIGPNSDAALAWASDLVDVIAWHSMSRPYPGAYVDGSFSLVRDLARQFRPGRAVVVRIESDPSVPGVPLLTVRERWTATDLESDPIYFCEHSGFIDDQDMLRQVTGWFGLAGDQWETITPGVEWRHS
jgi:hypothetical protein